MSMPTSTHCVGACWRPIWFPRCCHPSLGWILSPTKVDYLPFSKHHSHLMFAFRALTAPPHRTLLSWAKFGKCCVKQFPPAFLIAGLLRILHLRHTFQERREHFTNLFTHRALLPWSWVPEDWLCGRWFLSCVAILARFSWGGVASISGMWTLVLVDGWVTFTYLATKQQRWE